MNTKATEPRWRLRYRFIIVMVIVAVIAVSTVGLFSSRVTSRDFDSYLMQDAGTNLDRFRPLLQEHYLNHLGWNDVQPLLEQIGKLTGRQLILLDAHGNLLAAASIAPIRRGDRSTGGAGLGLAIVKQLILAHGGQIRAESIKGDGTTIYFTLPVVKN